MKSFFTVVPHLTVRLVIFVAPEDTDEELELEGELDDELGPAEATWVISGAGISLIADDPTEDV